MASFRESKVRSLSLQVAPREEFYEQLKVSAEYDQGGNTPLAASSSFFSYLSGSGVAVLPLESTGKNHIPVLASSYQQPLIRHHQSVRDLSFNPFRPDQLFVASLDGSVGAWNVPSGGYVEDPSEANGMTKGETSILEIACHPLCDGLLACRGQKQVELLDMTASASVRVVRGFADDVQSIAWSFAGDVAVAATRDKQVHVVDVRAASISASCDAHSNHRSSKCTWLGDSPFFLSCGHTATHDREVAIWDARQMEEPVKRIRVDSSPGPMLPFFDPDLNILTLIGKGGKSFRLYEFDSSNGAELHPIGNIPLMVENIRGAAFLPKQKCDLMRREINRVLTLSDTMIQPVSYTIPRREKLKFHSDLFPDTVCGAPSSLSSDKWLEGENGTRSRIAIAPPKEAIDISSACDDTESNQQDDDDSAPSTPASRCTSTSSKRLSLGSTLKFRHTYGKENTKDESYFNLSPALGASDGPLLACNQHYWACPWSGGGGPVYVSPHSRTGKVLPTCPLIKGHKGAVSDIAFSPYHDDLLVTASDDAKAKLWRIPEGGLTEDLKEEDALADFTGHRNSVKSCLFHPTVAGALATASSDNSLRIWDVNSSLEVFSTELDLPEGGSISNICFNYDGSQVAASCKDKVIRFIDPRQSTVVGSTPSQALGRNLRIVWACNSKMDVVLATSAVDGKRQLSCWDPRNLDKALMTLKFDSQSGILYPFFDEDTSTCILGGKGDTTFKLFELNLPAATEEGKFACSKSADISTSGGPIAGMCVLPKTVCDFKSVEVNRVLKLTADQATPISLILPRAENLKEYFQDDVFPPTRSRTTPAASVSEWVEDPSVAASPVYESLQPPGMELLSNRVVEPVKVTKAQQFRDDINKKEDEDKKREETFQRLQDLAIQRSKFHPNASGGSSGHGFKVDATPVYDDDDSDDGWSD